MKRLAWVLVVLCLAAAGPGAARADLDLVVNVLPASLLIRTGSDRFSVIGAEETVRASDVFLMPNVSAGIGWEAGDFYLDLTGGGGVVVNDAFKSFMLQVAFAASYMATDSFNIGPHLGLIYFTDPKWTNGDVKFDDEPGLLAGLQMSMGDRILYMVSVDLISASFDAESRGGAQLSGDKLKLTGLAIQFGVRGEF